MNKYELVRNLILDLRPFYRHELIGKASEAGITDNHIVFQVLDDLFDEGLVVYRKDGSLICDKNDIFLYVQSVTSKYVK